MNRNWLDLSDKYGSDLRNCLAVRCNALGLNEHSDMPDWIRLQNGLKVRRTRVVQFYINSLVPVDNVLYNGW